MRSKQEIFDYLQDVLVNSFEVPREKIVLEAQLFRDLDIDSIDAVDLIIELKPLSSKKAQPGDFNQVRTVADVVDAMYALQADPAPSDQA
jgi:acyl carrier protein